MSDVFRLSALRAITWRRAVAGAVGLALAGHLLYGTVFFVYSLPRTGWLPFTESFQSGNLERWNPLGWRQLCCDHSVQLVVDPVRTDHQVARFELRREDPLVRGSKRAEMRLPAVPFGQEFVYAISVYLPADWVADALPVNLFQWHSVSDKLLLEGGVSQPLRLVVIGNQWLIDNFWDSKRVTKWPFAPEHPEGNRLLWSGPVQLGRWVDWEFRVQWAYDNGGRIQVRKDGVLLVEATGANTYNDFIAPYLKFGVYVPAWSVETNRSAVTRRVAYFRRIEVHAP